MDLCCFIFIPGISRGHWSLEWSNKKTNILQVWGICTYYISWKLQMSPEKWRLEDDFVLLKWSLLKGHLFVFRGVFLWFFWDYRLFHPVCRTKRYKAKTLQLQNSHQSWCEKAWPFIFIGAGAKWKRSYSHMHKLLAKDECWSTCANFWYILGPTVPAPPAADSPTNRTESFF